MAYTALNLVTDVLLDMGVIADEVQPTASQVTGALTKLNDLIESWNLDKLSVYGATEYVLPLVAGKKSYTIGTGGDLNVPRPVNVTAAFVRDNNVSPANRADVPIEIFNNDEYANLAYKNWQGSYPFLGIWFNNTYPYVTAYVNPVPRNAQYSIVFWDSNSFGTLLSNTVLSLAPGYKRALKYQLFMELAPSYQKQIPEEIMLMARASKGVIERNNLQIDELDTFGAGQYNIYANRIFTTRN